MSALLLIAMASLGLTLGLCEDPSPAALKMGEKRKREGEDGGPCSAITSHPRRWQTEGQVVPDRGQQSVVGDGPKGQVPVEDLLCSGVGMFKSCSSPGEALTLWGPQLGEGFGGPTGALSPLSVWGRCV